MSSNRTGGNGLTISLHSGGGVVDVVAAEVVGATVVGAGVDGSWVIVVAGTMVVGADGSGGSDDVAAVAARPEAPVLSCRFKVM